MSTAATDEQHESATNAFPRNAADSPAETKTSGLDGEVFVIDPHLCDLFPGNGRASTPFCPQKNKSLIEDIRRNGQQQPVTARRVGDRYEVIAGTRRLGAIIHLCEQGEGLKLRATLVQATTEQAWLIAEKENADRRNFTPIQRARSWRYAIDRLHGGRQDLFAESSGEHPSTVSRTLLLLDIPTGVLSALRDPESVSVNFAVQLAPFLKDEKKQDTIIATAKNLAQLRLSGPALLERLISSSSEIEAAKPVLLALGQQPNQATVTPKAGGGLVVSIKPVDVSIVDERARKVFLRSIEEELRNFLQIGSGSGRKELAASLPPSGEQSTELQPRASLTDLC